MVGIFSARQGQKGTGSLGSSVSGLVCSMAVSVWTPSGRPDSLSRKPILPLSGLFKSQPGSPSHELYHLLSANVRPLVLEQTEAMEWFSHFTAFPPWPFLCQTLSFLGESCIPVIPTSWSRALGATAFLLGVCSRLSMSLSDRWAMTQNTVPQGRPDKDVTYLVLDDLLPFFFF